MIGEGVQCDRCEAKVVNDRRRELGLMFALPEGWVQIITPDDGHREFCGWPCANRFTVDRVLAKGNPAGAIRVDFT